MRQPLSKNILDNLFGSRIRIKILKFLFRNQPGDFTVGELARRTQESRQTVKKEIEMMTRIGLLKRRR
jgi:DNA-binding IclR family transcriptional regulator